MQRSSQERHKAYRRRVGVRTAANPNLGPIAGKTGAARRSQNSVFPALRQIREAAASNLAYKEIERTVAVGDKRDELAVRRDFSREFRAFKIREPREGRVRQRI